MKKIHIFLLSVIVSFLFLENKALATDCANATIVPASPTLPYAISLVCGTTDDINAANSTSCGNSDYKGGYEAVYSWTPASDYINVSFDYSGQTWTGIFLYEGCPTSGGTCIGTKTSSGSTKILSYIGANSTSGTTISLTAGVTYYIVVDTWPTPDSPCPGTLTINGTIGIPCTTPSVQPTNLLFSNINSTSLKGTFNSANGSDSYLVVRTTVNIHDTPPVNGTLYTAGTTLGNGTVVYSGTDTSFNESSLSPTTQYFYFVYSQRSQACVNVKYLTTNPLTANTYTAPDLPASFTATTVSTSQINLSVTANAANSDIVVAYNTTNTFGAPSGTYSVGNTISGGGTILYIGPASGLTTHTGLNSGTTYYYRAWSILGGLYSTAKTASAATVCAPISSFPWVESFENLTTPSLPTCWIQKNVNGDGDYWQTYSGYGVGGSKSAGLYTDYNSGANNDYLIFPALNLNGNQRLKFSIKARSSAEPNDYRVVLSTTDTSASSFTTVLKPLTTVSNTTMTQITPINLSAYTGTVYIAIHVPSGGLDGYYLYVDSVIVENIPTCLELGNTFTTTSVTENTATLSWVETGTATSWDIAYDTSSVFLPGSGGVIVPANSNPFTLNSLTTNTKYYYFVRSSCSSTDKGEWSLRQSFVTLCNAVSFPVTQNFDGVASTPNLPECWRTLINTTLTSGPSVATSTSNFKSSPNSCYLYNSTDQASDVVLISPKQTTAPITTTRVKFWGYGSGSSVIVGVMSNPADANTFAPIQTIALSTTLSLYTVNLDTYVGTGKFIAFRHANTGASQYIYLDDISWELIPACIEPSATLTVSNITPSGATLGWTENGTATQWQVAYHDTAFTPGGTTGTIVMANANPFALGSLQANKKYYFYVRSYCSSSEQSIWVGPQTFTTLCNPASVPYNEGFESITTYDELPSCMSATNLGTNTFTRITDSTYNRKPRTGTDYGVFKWSMNDWFFTAPIQLTAGQNYMISIWYRTDGYTGWDKLETKIGSSASVASMTNTVATVLNPTDTSYKQLAGTFTPSTSGTYYAGINCVSTSTNPWYLCIDDIKVDVTTSPNAPQAFNAAPVSSSQINLTWTPNANNDQVMLVTNTTNTFGTPVDGTVYAVGATIPGGGTVLYKGTLASFNHTGLAGLTTYYYKLWSVNAVNGYSLSGLTKNATTSASLPFQETFDASTSIPTGWSTDFAVLSTHGTSSSNGLAINLDGYPTTGYISLPFVGTITATTELSFDYRIVNYSGYPGTATTLITGDSINILVSTDGINYTKIDQINSTTHTSTTSFTTKTYNLSAFTGSLINVKFDCKYATGDYWVDFDNVSIIDMIPMVYTSSTTTTSSTAAVALNSNKNQILGITVNTTGILTPLTASSFTFNTNGSTNPTSDIITAKLWTSGTSSNFATATLLGDTVVSPNGPFSISTGTGMPYTLATGTNYFWLTYDVPATAVAGNTIDAELTSLVVGGATYIPTVTAPTGARLLKGSLSGTYTINNTLPTSGTNYNSFTDAFNDLNIVGVGGPTTFNVVAGQTHNYTITGTSPNNYALSLTATGTQSNPITFQKSGSGSNPVISVTGTSASDDKGIWVNGGDYISFNGIDVVDAGIASASWLDYGYYFTNASGSNGCTYNTVKNSLIDLSKGNSSSIGVYLLSSATSATGANKYNKFYNNTVQDAAKGYQFTGVSATYFDAGNEIGTEGVGTSAIKNIGQMSNTFQAIAINTSYQDSLKVFNTFIDTVAGTTTTNPAACGLNISKAKNALIYGNTIRQVSGANGDAYMINYIDGYVGTSEIYNNYLTELRNSGTGGNANNMRLYGVTSAYNMNVYNNVVDSSLNTVGDVTGIYIGSVAGCTYNVYKNKLYNLKTTAAAKSILAIHTDAAGFYNIYNNLVFDIKAPTSTTTASVRGLDLGGGTIKAYYNTVYIDYTSTVALNSSAAIYASTSPASIDLRNNIFINKTNITTGTRAAAFWYTSTSYTNLATTSNNNIYYAGIPSKKSPIFYNGTNTDSTLAQFKTRMSSRDQLSNTEDVPFLSNVFPYNLNISTSTATRTESNGQKITSPAITTDINGTIRWGETGYTGSGVGTDIGAYEFNGITIDEFAPAISYTALTIDTLLTNRSLSNVTITDGSGVNVTTAKPRVYFKKTANANTYVDNLNSTDGWKYAEASNTTSPFNFNLDYNLLYNGVNPTDTIQYFVIAQDMIGTPNIGANIATFTTAPSSVDLSAANFPVSGSINFYRIALKVNGTYNVGAGNTFRDLTANADSGFFKFVNSNIITGNIIVNITSDTIWENGAVALNQTNEGGVGNYTIKIQPANATPKLILGTVATGMIRLDGTDRVTIDGASGGSGMYLRFRNLNTSNPTFTFLNGATNNTITNSIIEGATTSSSNGVIFFSTSTASTGNSNNAITNDSIRNTLSGLVPANLIYSSSTTGLFNSNNTITNNHLVNFTTSGVSVTATNGSAWNVSNNYIYQTAARTTALRGISILTGTNGNSHIVNGNSIGGSNSARGGNAFATTKGITAIELSVDSTTTYATQVQGNIISNLGTTSTGSTTGVFGLSMTGGSIDVGTVTGNTFGGGATSADTIRNGYDNGIIYMNNSLGGTYNVQNNLISHISYYSASGDRTAGVYSSITTGKLILKKNIIHDLKANGSGVAYSFLPVGILLSNSNTGGNIIDGNTIYNIASTNTGTSAYSVAGLIISGNVSGSTISNNKIYDIKATGTGTGLNAPVVNGIYQSTASATFYNNVINLGNGIPTEATVYGINNVSTDAVTNNYYYNTISISGTATGVSKTFAFYRSATGATTNAVNLKNNILSNTRSGGAYLNFALGINSLTAVTSNYNLLYTGNDTVAYNNAVKYTFADWKTASTFDANSVSGDPLFTSATDLTPQGSSPAVGAATPIVGYTKDIANNDRNFLAPTIGAYEVEASKTLNLKAYLQNLFDAGTNEMIPVVDENSVPVYSAQVADIINVELHDAINTSDVVASFTGKNLNTDGTCQITGIQATLNGSYYIVVKHRNSIQTWSANPVSFTSEAINYDFTTSYSQAYGDNMVEVSSGIYAIWGGDVNQDGLVDGSDLSDVQNESNNFTVGYVLSDVNGDGLTDGSDLSIVQNNSNAFVSEMYP